MLLIRGSRAANGERVSLGPAGGFEEAIVSYSARKKSIVLFWRVEVANEFVTDGLERCQKTVSLKTRDPLKRVDTWFVSV